MGSDWPVAEGAGGYRAVLGSVIRVVRDLLPDSDAARVLAGTATRVYGLDRPGNPRACDDGHRLASRW